MNLRHFIILFFLLFFISACGSPPVRQEPYDYLQQTELNQRGNSAFERKDYKGALGYYNQALKISRSLDDTSASAHNLISMALAYRKLKNSSDADRALEEALALENLSPALISEAQFQKALINLDAGKPREAQAWAEKSLASCNAADECRAHLGARWNLLGRAALQQGQFEEAWNSAAKGLDFAKKYGAANEEANAYRLMGQIKSLQKDFAAAKEFYAKSLGLDKAKGQSYKVLLDLKGLAEVYALEGQTKEAVQFYQRAYEVAKNSGEEEEAEKILQVLAKMKEGSSPIEGK